MKFTKVFLTAGIFLLFLGITFASSPCYLESGCGAKVVYNMKILGGLVYSLSVNGGGYGLSFSDNIVHFESKEYFAFGGQFSPYGVTGDFFLVEKNLYFLAIKIFYIIIFLVFIIVLLFVNNILWPKSRSGEYNKKIVLLLVLMFGVITLFFTVWRNPFIWDFFKKKEVSVQQVKNVIVSTGTTTSPSAEIQSIGKNLYTNQAFQYSIQYPKNFEIEPETSAVDQVNKLNSIVVLHDDTKTIKVQIIVNEKEMPLKFEAPKKEIITIDGSVQTAYIFPKGYEGCNSQTEDCSFFIIPIFKNGIWYELHGKGKATSVTDTYKNILSTFKFIK